MLLTSTVFYDTEMYRAPQRNEEVVANGRMGISCSSHPLVEVSEGAVSFSVDVAVSPM